MIFFSEKTGEIFKFKIFSYDFIICVFEEIYWKRLTFREFSQNSEKGKKNAITSSHFRTCYNIVNIKTVKSSIRTEQKSINTTKQNGKRKKKAHTNPLKTNQDPDNTQPSLQKSHIMHPTPTKIKSEQAFYLFFITNRTKARQNRSNDLTFS